MGRSGNGAAFFLIFGQGISEFWGHCAIVESPELKGRTLSMEKASVEIMPRTGPFR
jgi:hypothetical protein